MTRLTTLITFSPSEKALNRFIDCYNLSKPSRFPLRVFEPERKKACGMKNTRNVQLTKKKKARIRKDDEKKGGDCSAGYVSRKEAQGERLYRFD